jgi:iron complex transport system substrate-binding protein
MSPTQPDPAASPAGPRIVSLLPAATEIVCSLGLGPQLVGRSHECDWPAEVAELPACTAPRIDPAATSRAIHEAVEQAGRTPAEDGSSLYRLDARQLSALRPDLVITQTSCDVCAIAADDVTRALERTGCRARLLSLAAASLADLFADILAVGEATGRLPQAREMTARLRARVDSLACRAATLHRDRRPRVAVVEWLDPPMAAGNWVPEMVRLAGGEDPLGQAGRHSHWIEWAELATADPDIVILAPCGFGLDRVIEEASTAPVREHLAGLRAAEEGRLFAIDGHHLVNRPGPRLVDSLEVIASLIHPGRFCFEAAARFARPLTLTHSA